MVKSSASMYHCQCKPKTKINVVGLATRVAGFEVIYTSKLEFGHAATIQECDGDNHCGLKKAHLLVVHNT